MAHGPSREESLRQQRLLQTLWRREPASAMDPLLRPLRAGLGAQRGLKAYQATAGAAIERALASAFPTVMALVGDESFAALARAYWHAHPPTRGDLAWAGDALPDFIAHSEQLADVPYLADVARLDAAMDAAERAADAAWQPDTLPLLGQHDPARLGIELVPGTAVISSAYPIVMLRNAHRRGGDAPFTAARDALQRGVGEHALVWRSGFRACLQAMDGATAAWTHSLLRGDSLAAALDQASPDFDFERWLIDALGQGRLARIRLQ